MTPQQSADAQKLFLSLCEIDPAQRERLLDERCGGDAIVRARVQALLAQDSPSPSADSFLETPAIHGAVLPRKDNSAALIGDFVASAVTYRLIRPIGEGGMGVVYEAEQGSPRRRVAVKLMRHMSASSDAQQRFRHEGELLGRLRHAGIAAVHETGFGRFELAGRTIDAPFIAMEFVEGTTLIQHAAERHIDVRARIELMARVCDAVQHAHEQGVIHRDLKPANILVESSGQPKILDFGVARAVDADMHGARLTQSGQWVGTPAYMSPEQVAGDWLAIDTRADIYAIGVILYEMLVGKPPLDLHDVPLAEAARRISDVEPVSIGRVKPELRGDISTIVAKALEKDKSRRYSSAAELGEDLRRYLRNDPITARPITATYLFAKFVRRNRVVVATVALTLVGGIAGLTYGLLETRAQRDAARAAESRALAAGLKEIDARQVAERQARIAAAVNQFLNEDLLAGAGPDNTPNPEIKMRDVLDSAAEKIEGRFPDEPLVEAATRAILGMTYLRMGEHADAEKHLTRAVTLRRQHLDPSDPELFETVSTLANLYYHQGRLVEAEKQFEELVSLARRTYPEDNPLTFGALGSLGFLKLQLGNYSKAEPLLFESMQGMRRLSPDSVDTVRLMVNLAMCYGRTRRTDEAVKTLREAVDLAGSVAGEDHPDTLNAKAVLAALYNEQRKFDLSIPLLESTMSAQVRVLGEEHPQTLLTRSNLGCAYLHSGRLPEAEPVLEQVFEIRERLLGTSHPHALSSQFLIGLLRHKQGRLADAEEVLQRGLDIKRELSGDSPPPLADWIKLLTQVLEAQGKQVEADTGRAKLEN